MRLAKLPVDSTPPTEKKRRSPVTGGGRGGRGGTEQQFHRKEEERIGELQGCLSGAKINRAPGTNRSESGSLESTYHRGLRCLLQQARGHQGTPRATFHKCGSEFTVKKKT